MKFICKRRTMIVVPILVSVLSLIAMGTPAGANVVFFTSCRAVEARVNGQERTVANPPGSPCASDVNEVAFQDQTISVPGAVIEVKVWGARAGTLLCTPCAKPGGPIRSVAGASGQRVALILNGRLILLTEEYRAQAEVNSDAACSAKEVIGSSEINEVDVGESHFSDSRSSVTEVVPGVRLHKNMVLRDNNTVTTRVLWLENGLEGDIDVVIGEATASLNCITID